MNNCGYVFAAYAFIWAMVLGYLYRIARRQSMLEREIAAMQEALEHGKQRGCCQNN